ncbi:type VII secretion protein EccE [Nocardia transvalensis]|uniref:Type VII secretion protein EccE n=1 Tax=Nocardia transvalensis TaxID=37333 RepID=A0A7W9UH02_9NOCA|nr:type VII secretion protein EccE [Nocardia transvalensis]MBB5912843.1 type VII secretion protein EccE [Nocardia transvalensis]
MRDPEFPLFRLYPLRLVVPVLLLAAAAVWGALAGRLPVLAAAGIGAAVAVVGLMPVRRRDPRTVAGIVALSLGYRWRRRRDRDRTYPEPFDVPLPEGGSYGLRWDGDRLITMLRIEPPPDSLTLLRRGALSTDQLLPLAEIARCLGQFDITLASIDVISTGSRTARTGFVAQLYDRILGPLPAIAHRTVWLVLRLDPLANAQAVDSRGGGATGTIRSAVIATRRVANRLAARDIAVSVLTANEMNGAVRQLTHGIALDELAESPASLHAGDLRLTSYEIGADLINSAGFAALWATPSIATTVSLRLKPSPRRSGHDDGPPAIVLDAVVRFDTAAELSAPPVSGLRALPGRQLPTLLDTLPIGSQARRAADPGHRGPITALTEIVVPTAGCGQLIGADATGQGIAVPLVGEGTRHVEVVGKLDLAQQVVLRAIALGARAVVHTHRPEAWQSMVRNVNAPQLLSLAPRLAGTGSHAVLPIAHPGTPASMSTVLVFDGTVPASSSGGATIVHVRSPRQEGGHFDPDITLAQDESAPNVITVRTPAAQATVQMVTTPDEMRYIGESLVTTR